MKKEYDSRRKRYGSFLVSVVFFALSLTGCGAEVEEKPITGNAVVVTEEGRLVSYLVDTFDKDYYDAQELAAMAMQEAESFSADVDLADTAELVISGAEVWPDTKQVALIMEFANAESYALYYGVETFYGTVNEALSAGWSLSGKLMDTKNGNVLSDEKIGKYGEKMIFISQSEIDIRVPGKVIAEGEDAGLKYILIK